MTRRTFLQSALCPAALAAAGNVGGDAGLAGDGTRLFLDRRLIAETRNLELAIAPPAGPVRGPLTIDGRTTWTKNNIHAIVNREGRAGAYSGWWLDMRPATDAFDARWMIPMTSPDGVNWTSSGEGERTTGVIVKDTRESDPGRRYKLLFQGWGEVDAAGKLLRTTDVGGWGAEGGPSNSVLKRGVFSAWSPDGRTWRGHSAIVMEAASRSAGDRWWTPGSPGWAGGDNFPSLIHAPEQGRWVAFYRTNVSNGPGKRRERAIGRSDSPGFDVWGPHSAALLHRTEAMAALGHPHQDYYQLQVWRWAGIYLGALSVFYWKPDIVHLELAWSPDTVNWERVCPGTDLVPHGPLTAHGGGCRYAAMGVVADASGVRLYFGEDNGRHNADGKTRAGALYYAAFAPHRWAGYRAAGRTSGELVTQPFAAGDAPLAVNVDATGGDARAELQDAEGRAVPGFELAKSEAMRGSVSAGPLRWRGAAQWDAVKGKSVRLRLALGGQAAAYGFRV